MHRTSGYLLETMLSVPRPHVPRDQLIKVGYSTAQTAVYSEKSAQLLFSFKPFARSLTPGAYAVNIITDEAHLISTCHSKLCLARKRPIDSC